MLLPDKWVILKIESHKSHLHYRVLAGWDFYLEEKWQLNSGIISVKSSKTAYEFFGTSGSCYVCHKGSYGFTKLSAQIFKQLKEQYEEIQLLSGNIDFMNFPFSKIESGIYCPRCHCTRCGLPLELSASTEEYHDTAYLLCEKYYCERCFEIEKTLE